MFTVFKLGYQVFNIICIPSITDIEVIVVVVVVIVVVSFGCLALSGGTEKFSA